MFRTSLLMLREKALNIVKEVVAPLHDEQTARLERLEHEITELRADIGGLHDRLIEFEIRSRRDIVYAADQNAAADSHRFVREHMLGARAFRKPWETLGHAISLAPTGGLALEFGVATGKTLTLIAERWDDKQVYGFDSFQGLPEDWISGVQAGAFAREDLQEVPGAELVVGLFEDTLPDFLRHHPGPVDFMHVDSDLYSSAVTVLQHVGPRLRAGSVIVFDEFFNYPGWQDHEHRAWQEYVRRTGVRFEYVAYSYEDCQVAVRILES